MFLAICILSLSNSTSSCNSPIFIESKSGEALVFPIPLLYLTCSFKLLFSCSRSVMVVCSGFAIQNCRHPSAVDSQVLFSPVLPLVSFLVIPQILCCLELSSFLICIPTISWRCCSIITFVPPCCAPNQSP